MPPPRSNINQPRGNRNCYVYSALCAQEVRTGVAPNALETIARIGARIGGNTDAAFRIIRGYGFTLNAGHRADWSRVLQMADTNGHPIAIGVTWRQGRRTGNHWVYYVGQDDQHQVLARDQQNGHLLISIDPNTWRGSAEGGWLYEVTQIGVGCAGREEARPYPR